MSGVICQMEAKGLTGLTTDDLDIDGKLHRFRPDWEPKASKKRAWYVLFKFRTDAGVELISGSFGWFKGADSYSFNVDIKPGAMLSSVERSRLEHEQAAYSGSKLPPIPDECCHPFHFKAATDSG